MDSWKGFMHGIFIACREESNLLTKKKLYEDIQEAIIFLEGVFVDEPFRVLREYNDFCLNCPDEDYKDNMSLFQDIRYPICYLLDSSRCPIIGYNSDIALRNMKQTILEMKNKMRAKK